jgi:hypothetical protein
MPPLIEVFFMQLTPEEIKRLHVLDKEILELKDKITQSYREIGKIYDGARHREN